MTVAIGNNGQMDRASGNARKQVPGLVNAFGVGSRRQRQWKLNARAPYSAVGPGSQPGVVAGPDGVCGNAWEPFPCSFARQEGRLAPQLGTSFALRICCAAQRRYPRHP